jgi:N-acetyl-alpha-D-glucosaminyl L-malate synthase BshA
MLSDTRMKIGITCYPSVGGSGVVATLLGQELAARGHDVHFISYERPFRLPEELPRVLFHPVMINDYRLFKYPDYTLPLSVKMAEVSGTYSLDILHVHYAVPHATAAIQARCMLQAAGMTTPRVVTTLHGTDTTLLGHDPGYGPAIRHALLQSDAVTTVSSYLKRETEKVFNFEGRIDVIHNFFEPLVPSRTREEVRRELGLGEEVLILHSSNLRPVKRIDLLLNGLARVKRKDSFKLVVLAGGESASMMAQAKLLGIDDRIVVRENVTEIEDYLQAADFSLFTSESESFCLSILEAMTFGCPAVSTRVGGVPEVVEDEVTGLLVPFDDTDALTAAIERMIDDTVLRKRLGEAARGDAKARFAVEAIVPKYENLYKRQFARSADCRL